MRQCCIRVVYLIAADGDVDILSLTSSTATDKLNITHWHSGFVHNIITSHTGSESLVQVHLVHMQIRKQQTKLTIDRCQNCLCHSRLMSGNPQYNNCYMLYKTGAKLYCSARSSSKLQS